MCQSSPSTATRDEKTLAAHQSLPAQTHPRTHLGSTGALQRTHDERTRQCAIERRVRARQIRVRGAAKVMAHLMYGVLALTVDQWMKLADHKT
ncbi:MAG: hypothetical protein M9913_23925 [Bryobacteraceae bacterium]|nr:hypothetical protein [Bryobacteraceae bacterium]